MIFIDTGAILSKYLKADQYHQTSLEYWRKIQQENRKCFTSNFVLDETATLLARRATYKFAAERIRNIYLSEILIILRPDYHVELEALKFLEKYADQKVSFTDCVSFMLMKKNGINTAFSFDQHFVYAGFRLVM